MRTNTTPSKFLQRHAASFIVVAVSFAYGQQPASTAPKYDKSAYAELTKVPEKARARRNPLEGDSRPVVAGRKLFGQHCAECHGSAAEGTRKAPSLLVDEVRQASPGALFWVLTNGVVRKGMPVWSKLPEPQRWQIVAYLESLRTSNEPPRPSPPR